MTPKLLFAVNVPIRGYRYHNGEWVTHITHRDLSFNLCEICGSQITDRRRSRTCSNRCTEAYWRRVREAERHANLRNPFFWPTFRHEALERDGHRCTQCGSTTDLEIHHITPVAAGGTNAPDNLTTLCHDCHAAIHAAEWRELAEERKRITEAQRQEAAAAALRETLRQHGGKTIEEW